MERKNKIKEKGSIDSSMNSDTTNYKYLVLLGTLSLILLSGLAYTASPTTVSSTSNVLIKGTTAHVDIKVDEVPEGIAGYKLELELEDKSKANIESIEHKGLGNDRTQQEKLGTDRYWISAFDSPESVGPGDKDVVLATVTLKGVQKGSTSLQLDINYLDGDQGGAIDYEVKEGTVDVIGEGDWNKITSQAQGPPQDIDGDGLFEDVNGNGELGFEDALMLYNNLNNRLIQKYDYLFDFNGDDGVDVTDAIALAFL